MKTIQYISMVTLLAGVFLNPPVQAESQADAAQQKINEAVSSGNVQAVIASLPILEKMWPQAIGDYFKSAEQVARFLGDAGDEPAVQQALETLFVEVMDKRCPEDGTLIQATAYFDSKQKLVGYYFGFNETSYGKPRLLAISRFLGEIRNRRIPEYIIRDPRWPGLNILYKAGVKEASSLTNPVYKAAYEDAMKNKDQAMEMNGLQLALSSADSGMTFHLLGACQQLRHDGKLDEEFANEVTRNAHLTEKEREIKFTFDEEGGWGR